MVNRKIVQTEVDLRSYSYTFKNSGLCPWSNKSGSKTWLLGKTHAFQYIYVPNIVWDILIKNSFVVCLKFKLGLHILTCFF